MSTHTQSAKEWVCPTCGKDFHHNTHWRRHQANHNNPNRFQCGQCSKTFARGDVYKKHIVRCAKHHGSSTIATCAKQQKTADVARRSRPSKPSEPPKFGPPLSSMTFLSGFLDPSKPTIQHYLNSTNNGGNFNDDAPDEPDPSLPNKPPHPTPPAMPNFNEFRDLFPPCVDSMLDDIIDSFDPKQNSDLLSPTRRSPIPIFSDDVGFDMLTRMSDAIVGELHAFHQTLPATDDNFDVHQARVVLCADHLRAFCATFFRISIIYVPIIHYATFGMPDTSMILVLAVAITGAFRSTPINHALLARGYGELVDKYILSKLEQLIASEQHLTTQGLQILQAALLVQHRLNMDNAFLKSRLQTLPILTRALRHFKLHELQYQPGLDWQQFITNETIIRVGTGIIAASWNHAWMFYYPPQVSIGEVTCSFLHSDKLWNALDSTSYILMREELGQSTVAPSMYSKLTTSVKYFVDELMADEFIDIDDISFDVLPVEYLYTAALALLTSSITACQMEIVEAAAPPLLRALGRWQLLWEKVMAPLSANQISKIGLAKHSNDYCIIARALLQAQLQQVKHPYFDSIGHSSPHVLYDLMKDLSTSASFVYYSE